MDMSHSDLIAENERLRALFDAMPACALKCGAKARGTSDDDASYCAECAKRHDAPLYRYAWADALDEIERHASVNESSTTDDDCCLAYSTVMDDDGPMRPIELSDDAWAKFQELISSPPEPTAALRELFWDVKDQK